MARIEKTVFISYRRTDISWALAVYQYLTSQKYDVFFDYTSIPSGDFEQIIVSNIRARAHFILILTPTALDRCSEPGDWLRREIETAIDEKRNIIPLFFEGFSFSSPSVAEKLTGKLAAIRRYNGLDIPPGYFMEAMERLSHRYLNVPLDAVIHPVSTEVRKVVKEEQNAVNQALVQKWEDIKELFRPAEEKSIEAEQSPNENATEPRRSTRREAKDGSQGTALRKYGIGAGILLGVALAALGINAFLNGKEKAIPTMTSQVVPNTISSESSATSPVETATPESQTPTPVPSETATPVPPTQTAIPTLGVGSTAESPKDGMTLQYIPAGEFQMGSNSGGTYEKPVHTVDLASFWMDRTEVTNAMYADCVAEDECNPPALLTYYNDPGYADFPVVYVSWQDATTYCSWAERRLPTEAEWEKVASWDPNANEKRTYPWGNKKPSDSLLNSFGLETIISEVGQYPKGASSYGVLDMAGNVSEWVNDWYNATYYRFPDPSNPAGPNTGTDRVVRGGSWREGLIKSSTFRGFADPLSASATIGFRCALSK